MSPKFVLEVGMEGSMGISSVDRLIETCISVCSKGDREQLLTDILKNAMEMSNCDCGVIYMYDNEILEYSRLIVKSLFLEQGGPGDMLLMPPVEYDKDDIIFRSLESGATINIKNINEKASTKLYKFDSIKSLDDMTGIKTKSILMVPIKNEHGESIGLMQLSNVMKGDKVYSFDKSLEPILNAIASQAGISITNMIYLVVPLTSFQKKTKYSLPYLTKKTLSRF